MCIRDRPYTNTVASKNPVSNREYTVSTGNNSASGTPVQPMFQPLSCKPVTSSSLVKQSSSTSIEFSPSLSACAITASSAATEHNTAANHCNQVQKVTTISSSIVSYHINYQKMLCTMKNIIFTASSSLYRTSFTFTGQAIPENAVINHAYIQFSCGKPTATTPVKVTICGKASDRSANSIDSMYANCHLPLPVTWNIPAWFLFFF
jgi:hypothetical protein